MRSNNIYRGYSLRKALGILVLILSLVGSAGAATWTVDDSGGADYTRIQDAIDNASTGDTILVYSGAYYENVIVNKPLTIKSASGNPDDTIIQPENFGNHILNISANYVNISGFKLTSASWDMAGIYINGANNINVSNNKANNNGNGIYLFNSNYTILIDNIANSNNYDGISLMFSSHNKISNNILNNNWGDGIHLGSSNFNTLSDNMANSNINNEGIELGFSDYNILSRNNLSNNIYGIWLYDSSYNTLQNNNASSNSDTGIFLFSHFIKGSEYNILNDNDASYNGKGIVLRDYGHNMINNNSIRSNNYGIWVESTNNIIYNNYFNNSNNAYDVGNNIWNISKTSGTNIINGAFLGGNFWSDYTGHDTNGDGLGDTLLPYNSSGNITNSGDFLPLTIVSTPTAGSISGFKINDTNGNGVWEVGETGIQGWNITLKNATAGSVIASNLTDANGFYQFMNLPNGSYNVTEEMRIGFIPTNATFKLVNIESQNVMNLNFTNQPMIQPVGGVISGFKINDTNGNGKWDTGEKGISNWTIRLIGISGKGKDAKVIRKQTFTDVTGFYNFENLPAGRYFIIEKLKKGFVPTSSPVKRIKLTQYENSMNKNFTNRLVHSLDKIIGQREIDDYEVINRNIDRYKEDIVWN